MNDQPLHLELAAQEFRAAKAAKTVREKKYHLARAMELQHPLPEVLTQTAGLTCGAETGIQAVRA